MKDTRTVAFLGRFQPWHIGHQKTFEWLSDKFEKVIIIIGSAEKSWSPKNPMTAAERYLVIRDSLSEAGFKHVEIFMVDDHEDDFVWVKHVQKRVPHFHAVVANNPYVWTLMREAGYDGVFTPPLDRKIYSASNVRQLMITGDNYNAPVMELIKWKSLVTDAGLRYLTAWSIEERVRNLNRKEEE